MHFLKRYFSNEKCFLSFESQRWCNEDKTELYWSFHFMLQHFITFQFQLFKKLFYGLIFISFFQALFESFPFEKLIPFTETFLPAIFQFRTNRRFSFPNWVYIYGTKVCKACTVSNLVLSIIQLFPFSMFKCTNENCQPIKWHLITLHNTKLQLDFSTSVLNGQFMGSCIAG